MNGIAPERVLAKVNPRHTYLLERGFRQKDTSVD